MASSKKALYAALAGNLAIAVTKFAAATISGSSAMLTEGIHSLVDTGNAGLMLFGIRRSKLPADENHPFGRGQEVYFWTFLVAMLIFALGGGMSIYEGIKHLQHPEMPHNTNLNLTVLAMAMVFEGASFWVAIQGFRATMGGRTTWQTIRGSKDPTSFAVLLEDAAAMLGLMVAFVGILLGHLLQNPYFDGAASVFIGLLLCGVALVLVRETKSLLVGESANPRVVAGVRKICESHPGIDKVLTLLSMHLGPEDILINVDLGFSPSLSAEEVERVVDELEHRIWEAYPRVAHIFIEADAIAHRVRGGD